MQASNGSLFDRDSGLAGLAVQVAASQTFARTQRHRDLLLFLANRPQGEEWKETWIGHHFFGRPADYDPKIDPVVRVEVRRLRERLDQYYSGEGRLEPLRLEIPKGGYQLICIPVADPASESLDAPASQILPDAAPRPGGRRVAMAAILVGAAAICGGLFWTRFQSPQVRSIAVPPMDIDPAAQMPGLANDIAAALSSAGRFRVVRPADADATLRGEAKVWNGRVKLQLRLERTRDSSLLWARTLDRDIVDPFALQEELRHGW